MAIQLSTQTTVAEVVSKFQWQRQKSNKEKDEIDTSRLRIKPKETSLTSRNEQEEHELALVNLYLYEVGGNIGMLFSCVFLLNLLLLNIVLISPV